MLLRRPPCMAVVAIVTVAFVCMMTPVHGKVTDGGNPFEGCRQPSNDNEKLSMAEWEYIFDAHDMLRDDDDDDDEDNRLEQNDIPAYCIADPLSSFRRPHGPLPGDEPRGLTGRGPSNLRLVKVEPEIPCGKNRTKAARGLDTHNAARLWCPTNGRKTRLTFEGEVKRVAGGGSEISIQLPFVGDVDDPVLSGEELDAALDDNTCLRNTYCRVPLHSPATIVVKVSEARTYWQTHPVLNHVAYAGRLDEARDIPTDVFINTDNGPVAGPILAQVSQARLQALAGTDDLDFFVVSGGPFGDCGGMRRLGAALDSYHDTMVLEGESVLSADGICDFQWADGLSGQSTTNTVSAQDACTMALCVGPGNTTASVVRYSEYGNHCTLHEFHGEGVPIFTLDVTVTAPSDGNQPLATTSVIAGGVNFPVPLKKNATAYTVHLGRGTGNVFWEERVKRGTNKATVRARAQFGPPPQPEGAPPQRMRRRNAEDYLFGPSVRSLDGQPLVCGRLHEHIVHNEVWPNPHRLLSASEYWSQLIEKSRLLGTDSPAFPPGLGANSSVLLAAGGPLRVPTAHGHGGADAAWLWVPRNESMRTYGRSQGKTGQSRTTLFWHSYDQLEDICEAGTNRTRANAYGPTAPQPCARNAQLNQYAHHPDTAQFVRGNAPAGETRSSFGAMERPSALPPAEVWDESSPTPGFYPVRVLGSPGGPLYGGGQRVPFGFVHENTRLGHAAEELAGNRHRVSVSVEIDDTWFHVDKADHYTRNATGTVYALRLLDNSTPSGESSHCIRIGNHSDTYNPYRGDGYIKLAYVTPGDTPVRTERSRSFLPLRKRYRAEIECDPSVGRFVPAGSRMEISPDQHSATVYFLAAVGGPAGMVTVLENTIRMIPPTYQDLFEYLSNNAKKTADLVNAPNEHINDVNLREYMSTGVCRISLFSNEPESSSVMVGRTETLPCAWHPPFMHETPGGGPARHKPAPPDCHFLTSDPRCSKPYWVEIVLILSCVGAGVVIVLLAALAIGLVVRRMDNTHESTDTQQDADDRYDAPEEDDSR